MLSGRARLKSAGYDPKTGEKVSGAAAGPKIGAGSKFINVDGVDDDEIDAQNAKKINKLQN